MDFQPLFFSSLPVARYAFVFQISEPLKLPTYAGSTLRGAFGRALRKISCMTKQADCKPCPLYRTCPYTNIFETPAPLEHYLQHFNQVPNAYVIEPPKWGEHFYQIGDELRFEMVLFGRLIEQLPMIAFAWKRAFEWNVAKGKGQLLDVRLITAQGEQSLLQGMQILPHKTGEKLPENLPAQLQLHFSTPLRLQHNGTALPPEKLNAERLLMGLLRRLTLLAEFHHQPLHLDVNALRSELADVQESKQLQWLDWTRYSSRQQQTMQLGGVVGDWTLDNLSPNWRAILYFGQWLHCGKNATFGLGKYQITNLHNSSAF